MFLLRSTVLVVLCFVKVNRSNFSKKLFSYDNDEMFQGLIRGDNTLDVIKSQNISKTSLSSFTLAYLWDICIHVE